MSVWGYTRCWCWPRLDFVPELAQPERKHGRASQTCVHFLCPLLTVAPLFAKHPPQRVLIWLLAGISLVHVMLGFALGLSGDEAHYAMYAAMPDWSYYDHPPLVGWVQWPLVAAGAPDGVLRLIPNLVWVVTAWLMFDITRQLALQQGQAGSHVPASGSRVSNTQSLVWPGNSADRAQRAGLWAVAAFGVAPVLHILGIGLLPDTLLMLWGAAVMRHLLPMLRSAQACSLRNWLVLGALLGLAGLSKYTAVFLAAGVVAALVGVHGWRVLARPAPWLAVLLAVLIILPVLLWNAAHDWLSFRYQLNHGSGSAWALRHMLGFLAAQLLLYPAMVWGLWACCRNPASWVVVRPLVWLAALPLGVLTYMAGGGTGLPHWTAPAWVAAAPLAGLGLQALWDRGRRRTSQVLLGAQALLSAGIFGLMLSAGPTWLSSTAPAGTGQAAQSDEVNPFTDFYGWQSAAQTATELAQGRGVKHLAVQNWTLASRLAWYARPLPVHVLDAGFDQFSLWTGPLPTGADALLMDWSQMAYTLPVGEGRFERCELLRTLPVVAGGRTVAHFSWFHCHNWGGQPAPVRQEGA